METEKTQTEVKPTVPSQTNSLGQPTTLSVDTTVTQPLANPTAAKTETTAPNNTEKVPQVNPNTSSLSTEKTTTQNTQFNVTNQVQTTQPTAQQQVSSQNVSQIPSLLQQTAPSQTVPSYSVGQMMSSTQPQQNIISQLPQTMNLGQSMVTQTISSVTQPLTTTPQKKNKQKQEEQTPEPRKEPPKIRTRSGRAVKQRIFTDDYVELSDSEEEEEEKQEKKRKRKKKHSDDDEFVLQEEAEDDDEVEDDDDEYVDEVEEPEETREEEEEDDEEYDAPKKKRAKRAPRSQTHSLTPSDGKVAIPQWNPMNPYKPLAPMLKYPILSGGQDIETTRYQTQQSYSSTAQQQPDPSVINSPGFQQYYQQYLKNMMNTTKNAIVSNPPTLHQTLGQHEDNLSFQEQGSLGMSGHLYSDTSQLLSSTQAPSSVLHARQPYDNNPMPDPGLSNPTNGYVGNLFNQDTFNK